MLGYHTELMEERRFLGNCARRIATLAKGERAAWEAEQRHVPLGFEREPAKVESVSVESILGNSWEESARLRDLARERVREGW